MRWAPRLDAIRTAQPSGTEPPARVWTTQKIVPAVTPAQRVAVLRNARLCHTLPHRWWPLGKYGQLCLRCSLYRRDPTAPDHGQG